MYCEHKRLSQRGSVKTGLTVLQKLDLFIQVDKYISTFLIINLVYLCIVNYLYRSFKNSNVNVVYLMQIPARDTVLFTMYVICVC
jgi:hypothetical protein